MINICTVTNDTIDREILDILLDSICKSTRFVTEVIIVKVDARDELVERFEVGKIKFKRVHFPIKMIKQSYRELIYTEKRSLPAWVHTASGIQHAFGLHKAIDLATEKYVWLTDPDVFFCYTNLDEFYLKMIEDYQLDIVGLSHYDSTSHANRFFCNHVNCLVEKQKLPGKDFLKNDLRVMSTYDGEVFPIPIDVEGLYLLPGKLPKYKQEFPNPDGNFETGSNLWLWAKWNDWKWLAFQTADCHLYTTKFYKGNVKPKKMRVERLLYHCISSVTSDSSRFRFNQEYVTQLKLDEERKLQLKLEEEEKRKFLM